MKNHAVSEVQNMNEESKENEKHAESDDIGKYKIY